MVARASADITTLVRMLGLRTLEEGVAIHRVLPPSTRNTSMFMDIELWKRTSTPTP